jgi:pyroglutamyl-peptidase
MSRCVLVVGFGPFGEVRENPASALARAVDGYESHGIRLIGREIPVEYAAGPAQTVALVRELQPVAVVGIGVATGRPAAQWERWGRRQGDPRVSDNASLFLGDLEPGGPDLVQSTAPIEALAAASDLGISEDAGGYVCNAWLYRSLRSLAPLPVAFLHIPAGGLPPSALLKSLIAVWGQAEKTTSS